jgi:dihydroorotase-like cyclic amidohydrolase
MSILIKNGTIVTADERYTGDVLVEGEKTMKFGLDVADRPMVEHHTGRAPMSWNEMKAKGLERLA